MVMLVLVSILLCGCARQVEPANKESALANANPEVTMKLLTTEADFCKEVSHNKLDVFTECLRGRISALERNISAEQ